MMSSVLNHSFCNDNQKFVGGNPQQLTQFPDHLKCGEVYTWLCAGELFAVECKLCEDHPLCPLSEFPQHMEVWHTDWEHTSNNAEGDNEDVQYTDDDNEEDLYDDFEQNYDDHASSFTTEDSGLFETDDVLKSERVSNQVFLYNEELLEPFEQVLIEHDNSLDSIQISGDVSEEKCLEGVNKPVAEALEGVTEREHNKNHDFNINMTSKITKSKQIQLSNELTEQKRELRYLPAITESQIDFTVMKTNFVTVTENVQKTIRKSTINLNKTKKFLEHVRKQRENETSKEENIKLNKKITKSKTNLKKTKQIIENVKKLSYNETKENENTESTNNERETNQSTENACESSKIESKNEENETKDKNNIKTLKKTRKSLRNLKGNKKQLTGLKEMLENQTEISENETGNKNFITFGKETINSQELAENKTKRSENGTETSVKLPKSNSLYKNSKQNLINIRKSTRNLRKTKRNFQNLKVNRATKVNSPDKCKETLNSKTNNRISETPKQLKEENQEKMKHEEFNEIEKPEFKIVGKLQKPSKARTTKRKLRKLYREFNEKELKSKLREHFERLPRESSEEERNQHESFESLLRECSKEELKTSSTNCPRNGKSKNISREPSKELNAGIGEEILEKELNIEQNNGFQQQNLPKCRQSKRKLKYSGIDNQYPELSSLKSLKLVLKPLENPTRVCLRSSKRKINTQSNTFSPNKTTKQTLVTHSTTAQQQPVMENSVNNNSMEETDTCSLSSYSYSSNPSSPNKLSSQGYYSSEKDSNSPLSNEPFSTLSSNCEEDSTSANTLSPYTEEEYLEFSEAKEKLNKHHVSYLIQLYQEHKHLWDQSHSEFCEPQRCRKSWQQITDKWNEFCQRKFTIAEVRIRLVTLCQRYVQVRERLALEGELDEFAKFPYYEQMQFLEQQKSLQQRRELQEQQNETILDIYQKFPILWHVSHYKVHQAKQRAEIFQSISKTLKLSGLHLSSMAVQKRIRSLRKCYRLEKIRYLHAQVEQTPFEINFRHYERMQFLHKHIKPFMCRICEKIFENLPGFREHLEAENHGTVLQEENESEQDVNPQETKVTRNEDNEDILNLQKYDKPDIGLVNENLLDYQDSAIFINNVQYSPVSENSTEILQTFTPLPGTPNHNLDAFNNLNLECLTQHDQTIQEVLIFSCNTTSEPITDSLLIENQLMEEIMKSVTNNDGFSKLSLDHFINSVTSCEELSESYVINEEMFATAELAMENANILRQPDLLEDQILNAPSPNAKNEEMSCEELTKIQETEQHFTENLSLTSPLVVNVQCADFSVDLKLNPQPTEIPKPASNDLQTDIFTSALPDQDPDFHSSTDISSIPLPEQEIHKMIELYRKYPQIWNPNHLDFNSRNLRRQAWCALTKEFNSVVAKHYSWRTLHRKLTDYAKYYKKLITEQKDYEELENKWTFYEDFKFLDDVIAVHDELNRTVHHRDNNFKIIQIYETLPQLWDIKHPDYNKHSIKQRNIELMCNRLQEENNLQLTTERLKNRLIELRTQYRAAKRQRLKCERNQQNFNTDFVFYEAFNFLDPHIDPFICEHCSKEFKKLTDYNRHLKREHKNKTVKELDPFSVLPLEPGVDKTLQNICHICGIKFTTRSNLVHHVRRHEGIRNYACSMCPKKFFASHSLKVHIRSHTKECPYTCEKCGMSFVSASKLNQHFKRHLENKEFQCEYCPKRFYTGFEKDRHERRHLNIRDKVCDVCGKTFVVGSSYYTHMMLHSDTKRFECNKCDMKFAQYAGLYKHKKRHHKI